MSKTITRNPAALFGLIGLISLLGIAAYLGIQQLTIFPISAPASIQFFSNDPYTNGTWLVAPIEITSGSTPYQLLAGTVYKNESTGQIYKQETTITLSGGVSKSYYYFTSVPVSPAKQLIIMNDSLYLNPVPVDCKAGDVFFGDTLYDIFTGRAILNGAVNARAAGYPQQQLDDFFNNLVAVHSLLAYNSYHVCAQATTVGQVTPITSLVPRADFTITVNGVPKTYTYTGGDTLIDYIDADSVKKGDEIFLKIDQIPNTAATFLPNVESFMITQPGFAGQDCSEKTPCFVFSNTQKYQDNIVLSPTISNIQINGKFLSPTQSLALRGTNYVNIISEFSNQLETLNYDLSNKKAEFTAPPSLVNFLASKSYATGFKLLGQVRFKGDWVGFSIPVGTPQIQSLTRTNAQTAPGGLNGLTLTIKNVGSAPSNTYVDLTCAKGSIIQTQDIINLTESETITRTYSILASTNAAVSTETCTASVYDFAKPQEKSVASISFDVTQTVTPRACANNYKFDPTIIKPDGTIGDCTCPLDPTKNPFGDYGLNLQTCSYNQAPIETEKCLEGQTRTGGHCACAEGTVFSATENKCVSKGGECETGLVYDQDTKTCKSPPSKEEFGIDAGLLFAVIAAIALMIVGVVLLGRGKKK